MSLYGHKAPYSSRLIVQKVREQNCDGIAMCHAFKGSLIYDEQRIQKLSVEIQS